MEHIVNIHQLLINIKGVLDGVRNRFWTVLWDCFSLYLRCCYSQQMVIVTCHVWKAGAVPLAQNMCSFPSGMKFFVLVVALSWNWTEQTQNKVEVFQCIWMFLLKIRLVGFVLCFLTFFFLLFFLFYFIFFFWSQTDILWDTFSSPLSTTTLLLIDSLPYCVSLWVLTRLINSLMWKKNAFTLDLMNYDTFG